MAKATKETREEQVMVTKEVTVVTLELSEDEANTLAAVLRLVGGTPFGPRGRMDSISSALSGSGYEGEPFKGKDGFINGSLLSGSVYFK